jgi:hypothetical protein
LARVVGVEVALAGPLTTVVIPKLGDGPHAYRAAPADRVEVARVLRSNCYTPTDPFFRKQMHAVRTSDAAADAALVAIEDGCAAVRVDATFAAIDDGFGGRLERDLGLARS